MSDTDCSYDAGVRIRGEHMMRESNPNADEVFGGLRLGHADATFDHLLEIRKFGGNGYKRKGAVELQREEIPKMVEELIKRAYPQDAEQLRERIDRGLEDLEQRSGDEPIYKR